MTAVDVPVRRIATGRGMFQDLVHEIRLRKAEGKPKRGTCFVEMRCPPKMNLYHRTKMVQDGVYASAGKGHKKGDPKFRGESNPFLDFENRDEAGKPKPTIVHVTRCRASIFYDYQAKVQAAQVRNEQDADFKAGPPAWEWRRFMHDGEGLPFAWKVERDKDGNEVEVPVAKRKIYLLMLPTWVRRDADGVVMKDESGHAIKFPENEKWYEDIKTGIRLTDAQETVLKEYLPEKDLEAIAEAQGHFNVDDIVQPNMPSIQNITYLAVLGKRYIFPQRRFGAISQTDFEALDFMVEDDELTTADERRWSDILVGRPIGYGSPIKKQAKK